MALRLNLLGMGRFELFLELFTSFDWKSNSGWDLNLEPFLAGDDTFVPFLTEIVPLAWI